MAHVDAQENAVPGQRWHMLRPLSGRPLGAASWLLLHAGSGPMAAFASCCKGIVTFLISGVFQTGQRAQVVYALQSEDCTG